MRDSRDAGGGTGDESLPHRVARTLRRIIGAPDYEAYLEHCRTAGHPPRLTEREYVERFFESKGTGVRCC
jgi:uncharacterized short protein YbdD (DUF466 family)